MERGIEAMNGIPEHLIQFMANVRAGRLSPPTAFTGWMDMPPDIPGMPRLPQPPPGFLHGMPVGGLFQPLVPVAPFHFDYQAAQQEAPYTQETAQNPPFF